MEPVSRLRLERRLGAAALAIVVLALGAGQALAADDRAAEVAQIKSLLESPDLRERVQAARQLYDFSGIADPAPYELIDRRLREDAAGRDPQELAWDAKALASSGNPKYRPTLEALGASKQGGRLTKHARDALAVLPDFARWNPIINNEATHVAGEEWGLTRARNMLTSGEPQLQRGGLRRLKAYRSTHPELYDLVAQELKKIDLAKAEAAEDIPVLDTAAWFCRALGESGDMKYEALLLEIRRAATTHKIDKGCKKGWETLKKGGLKTDEKDEE
ncbi:MAG TPA: hypothetical protein VM074_09920 [Solimonas sp.]|nr:hypothetical protein [Solimonas sp.]